MVFNENKSTSCPAVMVMSILGAAEVRKLSLMNNRNNDITRITKGKPNWNVGLLRDKLMQHKY
jgi:hypothetical protein